MNPEHDSREDEQLEALFASLDGDAVPPDAAVRERLLAESAEVFKAQFSPQPQLHPRRRRMFILAWRAVAAAGAACVVAAGIWGWLAAGDAGVPLGTVLENVAKAESVRIEVVRGEKKEEIWVKGPDRLRWDVGPGVYRIARGETVWLVDEAANRAKAAASRYFREGNKGVDALALLDLPLPEDRTKLAETRPAERVRRDGADCDVYKLELPATTGTIRVEAVADVGTGLLRSLEAVLQREGGPEPIGRLTVVEVNAPVDEDLFVVGDTLTEDGRIGKVADVQGIVAVKPMAAGRWTPLAGQMLLRPGDWVRTDLRGANAVLLRLVPRTQVTLGPGALVELAGPKTLRVHRGDLKIVAERNTPIEVIAPGDVKLAVADTRLLRVRQEKLTAIKKTPLWLAGFEGATAEESIGSLVANIDGRNVKLTVGYHKVTVDVRDQIARTVIEESFVNHTNGRLEGVFHFPLPQDASISGFGMWIGDELVEADVVEKQRAREIYEEILREKRDPGLLEWSGGNIFKARVFPIEAHSEKRIKISYTQVLPRRGNQFRYSYALRSEMLRQHPLRELAISVTVSSVLPIKGVACPTHMARIQQTKRSGRVEFTAQDYSPTRDFEVVVELDRGSPDVVVIPHRRGTDGYFMMLVSPPGGGDQPDREVLPDGGPLDIVILADTSASMDRPSREAQAGFVASLLGALTPRDRFNLAVCDVECQWAFAKSQAASAENVEKARKLLAERISLGWTDLDGAFASALKQCGPQTQLIYVGDGIVTTGDGDPAAFVNRLERLYEGRRATCHAVAVSSSFEPGVLREIASLGGGSFRPISGEQGPQAVAVELLGEIARPAIRDLAVKFEGLRTVRVYPEALPNLASGTQQILLGRYLPEGADQQGRVTVTGTEADKQVQLTASVLLKDAERGNSFIPRLWARMHLDHLLAQGASQTIKDEIIGLSEEYHIITPYTSLLVLESDADRERFGVKRRFQMRGGEGFFQEGRDEATYQLVQQQMRRAGTWRLGLRRQILAQLAALGRDARLFQPQRQPNYLARRGGMGMGGGGRGYFGLPQSGMSGSDGVYGWYDNSGYESGGQGLYGNDLLLKGLRLNEIGGTLTAGGEVNFIDKDENGLADFSESEQILGEELLMDAEEPGDPVGGPASGGSQPGFQFSGDLDLDYKSDDWQGLQLGLEMSRSMRSRGSASNFEIAHSKLGSLYESRFLRPGWPGQYTAWLDTLFPPVPPVPEKEPAIEHKHPWPAEARRLAESLLRTGQLSRLEGGLRIERRGEHFNADRGVLTSRSDTLTLVSPSAWLLRSGGYGSQTIVQWCDRRERGIFSKAFGLGRRRASKPMDLTRPPLSLSGYITSSIERAYRNASAELKRRGEDRTLLTLIQGEDPKTETRVLVDTARAVILSIERQYDGKVTSTTQFGQFVEVAGGWWAGRVETFDQEGRRTSVVRQTFKPLDADAFGKQHKQALAGRDRVQLIRQPLVKVAEAKRAVAAGKASFEERLALVLHFSRSQQWKRVMEQLEAAGRLAAGKPGMRWVRDAILKISRRREELKKRIMEQAAGLAKPQTAGLAKPQAAGEVDSEELFLADYLLGQAQGVFENNEMLALLDVLEPVYARQPKHLEAMKWWTGQRADYLRNTGQVAQALALRRQLAAEYPHDTELQRRYAQALGDQGDYKAAYAWLDAALRKADATHVDKETLRNAYAQLLRRQRRYPELADYLAAWLKENPEGSSPYQQYLSALVYTDREQEANALIARWLKEGRLPGRLPAEVYARLYAAVSQALGQGYNLRSDRIDERWHEPLAETALFFARHKTQGHVANQIMGNYRFRNTDACRRVRRKAAAILSAEIGTLRPEVVRRLVDWVLPNDPELEPAAWKRIAAGLRKRWAAEPKPEVKNPLGESLVRVLTAHAEADELLDFLRTRLKGARKQDRAGFTKSLFDTLLAQPWSAAHEDEALGLLEGLSDAKDPAQRLFDQVGALHRLTDRMVAARFEARMKKVEHQEKLTRPQLREKRKEVRLAARQGLANRLRKERSKHEGPLADWTGAERLYLDVRANRNLKQVEEECWEALGPEPKKAADAEDLAAELDDALRQRYLVTLANLAARRNADPKLAERLLAYLDRAITVDPGTAGWKLAKYRLLMALDRPKDLEESLRGWVATDEYPNRWRISLGYLLAEGGKIAPAIEQFEAVKAADELGPAEYRALAGWYMVGGRRQDYRRARIDGYKLMPERSLRRYIDLKFRPWQRSEGRLPSQLDEDVLLVFAALLEKSGYPQNYLWQLQRFYQATHDFRLLAGLADGVVGHTAGRVYPFLGNMDSVLDEIRDEATADKVFDRLTEVRTRAKTDVDRRALDLLEALVARRAAEVENQPGPHVKRALTAMRRAFKRAWSEGEPRLVADLLAGLGRISQQPLADEQLRELEVLDRQSAPGTIDRLHIAHCRARALWSYSRRKEAIDRLEAALAEFQQASGGVLPVSANSALDTFISYLESQRHYARGERYLAEQLKHPVHRQQRFWLVQRLYRLYNEALRHNGTVSLGSGQTLYRAVEKKLQDDLSTDDHEHRRALIGQLCGVYRSAKGNILPGVADDLRKFASGRLPEVLKRHTDNYQSIVGNVAQTLHDVAGTLAGLAFLVERIEQEPSWFRLNNQDGWSQHSWKLGKWRKEAGRLGELEPRLLAIVTAEIRRDLESRRQRNRNMYDNDSSYFWAEQADAFARTAEEVYARRKQSGESVEYIARYLAHDLDRYTRAIEMLLVAHDQGLLDESGQAELVRYLQHEDRYGESIPVLRPMIERWADNIQYPVWLLRAYFKTQRQDDLLALLDVTDKHFHQGDRWKENVIAHLAYSCLENELFEQSVAYYEEVVKLHRETAPRRGIGDGTLSSYQTNLAKAWAGLKNTAKAVDAAAEAVVSWGPRHDQRQRALNTLRHVLGESPNLDAYVADLDKETAESGLDKPIVRKAIGEVYAERQEYAKAIGQLQVAARLQPNDTQTHQKLVECYDKQKDREGAVGQLIESLELSRRNIELYRDLGRRYADLKRPQEAERAFTSIVEALPSESESHAMLAEVRQGQDRWDEAVAHWQRVAEIRALEPTGLLKLAAAQIHLKRWDDAEATLKRLRARSWPGRFGDVAGEVRKLERQIEQQRKK